MEKKNIIIIKIGSSTLLTQRNRVDEFRIAHILEQIAQLRQEGYAIVLVVSGAVALGTQEIALSSEKINRQLAAGIGQVHLISSFSAIAKSKHMHVSQMLLTRKDLLEIERREAIKILLLNYLERGILPILNENDVVELNSFGGNDLLASRLAEIMRAQLVILSTWEKNQFGVGGGVTKLEAVERLKKVGIAASIRNGKEHNCLLKGELI